MTARITWTSPESPGHTRINTHQIEPHLAKSGQIWTNLDAKRPNLQPTAPFPPNQAGISTVPCPFRVGSEQIGHGDPVRYHRL